MRDHLDDTTRVGDGDRRGQAFTLEAFSAAVILLASILFALQVTAVTPLTASTSSQHIENQLDATTEGVLVGAVEDGSLVETVLYWNESAGSHHDTEFRGRYTTSGPPTRFGETLDETFLERGIAFNVRAYYVTAGERRSHSIVDFGVPSDNAVSATKTVVLFDDDLLRADSVDPDGVGNETTSTTLTDSDTYYIGDDTAPSSGVYAVVEVEVVVWRM